MICNGRAGFEPVLSEFMAANLGIFLWTAARTLELLIGWPIYLSILLTAVVIGIYTLVGGLKAVVYTDAVQAVLLLIGAFLVALLSFEAIGGSWQAVLEAVPADDLSIIRPASDPVLADREFQVGLPVKFERATSTPLR